MPTLIDGREVGSGDQDYRAECEARHVCNMIGLQARRDYLALVRKKRGDAAADALQALIKTIWSK